MSQRSYADTMLLQTPPLTAVRAFIAAARYGSFTEAADVLCVTQAAVSKQIKRLEEVLGAQLFDRTGRHVELTPAGKRFFDATYLSYCNIYQAAERIKDKSTHVPSLSLCVSHAFSSLWLAPRLPGFFAEHPDVDFNLNIITTQSLAEQGADLVPDMVISMNSTSKASYEAIPLFHERIYPVCSSAFLEARPEAATIPGLITCPLLELSGFDSSQVSEFFGWDLWFALAIGTRGVGPRRIQRILGATDYNVVAQMAMQGQGVALGWHHLSGSLEASGLLIRPVEDVVSLPEKRHYLYYGKNLEGDSRFAAFRDWLLNQFEA